MCGISAIYRYTQVNESDVARLHKMNEEMYYRGPDDRDVWNNEICGMAQVRLSIIGLAKGKQPLFNEDKTLVLVINGEIYNYIELRKELEKKGHVFSSDTDSETILHLYEEYGVQCLEYLRGMYAFCLYDINKQELFAARDRIGEKTLYYSEIPCGVIFSTELKAILKHYIDNPTISIEQLAAPIRYTSPLSKDKTFIEQINKIEPGQYILLDRRGLRKKRYWNRNTDDVFCDNEKKATENTLGLMRESVELCLRSDVPVAVMLSGGIDSSAIAALAKECGRDVNTITAGYKGQHSCDERSVAKQFAKEKGFNYHEVELDKKDFNNCFEELAEHIDEPITDAAAIAQWALYKKVKNLGFKVLLGGMGGDELFYGYPYWNEYGESLMFYRMHQKKANEKKDLKKKIQFIRFFIANIKKIALASYPYKLSEKSIGFWQYEDYIKFSSDAHFTLNGEKYFFSDAHLHKSFAESPIGKELDLVYEFCFDNIMTMAYLYLSDRLGMGNSLEIRSPLLDYKLVEYVSGLPTDIKYKRGNPKYFLKKILKNTLPDYILYGPKKGFTPPDSFIKDVFNNFNYSKFTSNHKYYNSILADSILKNHINKP